MKLKRHKNMHHNPQQPIWMQPHPRVSAVKKRVLLQILIKTSGMAGKADSLSYSISIWTMLNIYYQLEIIMQACRQKPAFTIPLQQPMSEDAAVHQMRFCIQKVSKEQINMKNMWNTDLGFHGDWSCKTTTKKKFSFCDYQYPFYLKRALPCW